MGENENHPSGCPTRQQCLSRTLSDGLVVWAKRLERGRFQLPRRGDPASLTIEVDAVTLAMMIGGVDLDTAKRRKRYQVAAG